MSGVAGGDALQSSADAFKEEDVDPYQGLRGRLAAHVDRRTLLRRVGIGGLATGFMVAGSNQAQTLRAAPEDPATAAATDGEPQLREFELTAEEFDWELSSGTVVRAWGYNRQVPGPEIRVTEGDLVRIILHNRLSVPTTIHWHGINLRPEMDGVAGLNQAAVPPGEDFIYEFTATPAGSRWYHSHTDPALQVPIGLYGSLIVEPREPLRTFDRDYTYIFGEWDLELTPEVAAGRATRGPGDQMLRGGELGSDLFLMNGRTHGLIPPIDVAEGDRVLIRLMNAGHKPHTFHTHGHSFKIVATDGNPVPIGMEWTKDTVLIGPAERYDLELICDNPGVWMVHCHMEHHMANGMMTVIQYEGQRPTGPAASFMGGHEPSAHVDHPPRPQPPEPVTPEPAAAPDAGTTEISLVDDRIDPADVTVQRGTTVTWINNGADWHSVAAYDGSFGADRIEPGESYAYRFEEPGFFEYLCKHHALQGMIGRITVS